MKSGHARGISGLKVDLLFTYVQIDPYYIHAFEGLLKSVSQDAIDSIRSFGTLLSAGSIKISFFLTRFGPSYFKCYTIKCRL